MNAHTSLLKANGFRVGKARRDGSVRAVREVLSMQTDRTMQIVVIMRDGAESTVTASWLPSNGEQQAELVAEVSGTLEDMVDRAVTVAYRIGRQ
jgi:thymidine phosphorylase